MWRHIAVVSIGRLFLVCVLVFAAARGAWAQISSWPPEPPRKYLNTWLISGLYGGDQRAVRMFDRDWIGEAQAKPSLAAPSGGVTWRYFDDRLFSRSYDNYQDLYSYFAIQHRQDIARKCAYAATYVWSADARELELSLAADSLGKAWINGQKILDFVDGSGLRVGKTARLPLQAGWNLLLVKIGTQEDGRFGFYAAIGGAEQDVLDGLIVSPDPSAQSLSIVTSAMRDINTPELPTAWREWPYVEARAPWQDPFYGPASETRAINLFLGNPDQRIDADGFYLSAAGGVPPYTWNVGAGRLPPGLQITLDGRIAGTVSPEAELGDYEFEVWVRDSRGTVASRKYVLTVRERPNRWFESDRLTALSHNKRKNISAQEISETIRVAAQRGYRSVSVISYNNGDGYFRWPMAKLGNRPVDTDLVARMKREIESNGMAFGMYLGTLQAPMDYFGQNQGILLIRDMMEKFQPKIVWLDWSATDHVGVDALYSVIRTISPETVIVINGQFRAGTQGDWDSFCFEGWDAWGSAVWALWPEHVPWAKKITPESWRNLSTGARGWPSGDANAWKDMLRVQLTLIGQGFVADMDHSFDPCAGDEDSTSAAMLEQYRKMAEWSSPRGLPPLHPSFTQVDPAPLPEAPWGYTLLSTSRDTIYLHLMENPFGKTGMPNEKTLTINPIDARVKQVVWMNRNQPLKFSQAFTSTDRSVTISLEGIVPDEIDTIIKVELESPLPEARSAPQAESKNLAYRKPSRNLSADGQRLLYPSGRIPSIARYGVDGDEKTVARAAWEWAWSYEVDLLRAAPIERIVVTFPADLFPTEYRILTSFDGQTWDVARTVRNNAGGRYEHTMTPTIARWVRIQAVKPDGPDQTGVQMGIAELEVYEAEAAASR